MRPLRPPLPRGVAIAAAIAALAALWPPGEHVAADPPGDRVAESDAAQRARFVRRRLEDARAFRAQGRADAAERALRRGLEVEPDAADLHRTLARVLDELGRPDEAARHRARADALDPPEPPPPDFPLAAHAVGVLVVLLAPGPNDESAQRVARDWPEGVVARTLEERLRVRLPAARVVHAAGESVAGARAWLDERRPQAVLSLRPERAFCGDTLKDGAFSLVWLRVAAAVPGAPATEPAQVRQVVEGTPPGPDCEREATARALEQALALPAVADAVVARGAGPGGWSSEQVRALFPEIGSAVAVEIGRGRARLAAGDLEGADAAFRRAARLDPDDPEVRAYLAEVDASRVLSRALDETGEGEPGPVQARLSPEQRRAAEARLAEERRLRGDLLAALAVLDEDRTPPPREVLAALRPVELRDPEAFGPATARRSAGGPVEARAAYAPDGTVLARYYFAAGSDTPLLREEDTQGDGAADRWILYREGARSEVWEDARGAGRPDVRLVFAAGGAPLERIELDPEGRGSPERVFHYADGTLSAEARDTDGDGVLDRTDRFDDGGALRVREEDLDGDGSVDLRSFYRGGRLERREVMRPEDVPDGT